MIYAGMSAHVEGTFTDQDGNPADPAGVLFTIVAPDDTSTEYTQASPSVTHTDTGVYLLVTDPLDAGTWRWQVESTGAQPRITGGVMSVYPEPAAEHPDTALARVRLNSMTDADADPVISPDEIEALLAWSARTDIDGLDPTDPDWSPTYALGLAASEAWTWKAGRVAGRVDIADEAAKLSRSQMQKAFLTMADRYRQRPMSVVVLHRPYSYLPAEAFIPEGYWPLLPGAQGPVHYGPPYVSGFALPGAIERGDSTA